MREIGFRLSRIPGWGAAVRTALPNRPVLPPGGHGQHPVENVCLTISERQGLNTPMSQPDRDRSSCSTPLRRAISCSFPAPRSVILDQKRLFDCRGVTKDIPVKNLFLRDPGMMWYHHGLPGIGERIGDVARYVGGIRTEEKIRRVVMVGSSGGGR